MWLGRGSLWVLVASLLDASQGRSKAGSFNTCEDLEDMYYTASVKFSTSDSCSDSSLYAKMDQIILDAFNAVGEESKMDIKSNNKYVAADGDIVDSSFCSNPLVTTTTSGEDPSRRYLLFQPGGLRRLRTHELSLNFVGSGHWQLCYPEDAFRPKEEDSSTFFAFGPSELEILQGDIRSAIQRQLNEIRDLEDSYRSFTGPLETQVREIQALLKEELFDRQIELEELKSEQNAQWDRLERIFKGNVPEKIAQRLRIYQAKATVKIEKKLESKMLKHEKSIERIREQIQESKEKEKAELAQLREFHSDERSRWDMALAKLQAKEAQQRYLEDPKAQKKKQLEAVTEEFVSVLTTYQKAVEERVAETLWKDFHTSAQWKSSCFKEKPPVEVAISRVLTEEETISSEEKCRDLGKI